MITLLTISIGVPDLDAKVAACRRKSWRRKWMPTNLPAFTMSFSTIFHC
jgi:hypothetical protein